MRIAIEKGVFSVRWKHENKGTKKVGYTICIVDHQQTKTEWLNLCVGKAIKHKGDEYNKEQGRKISLANALLSTSYLSKSDRKLIWESYFNRTLSNPIEEPHFLH